MLEHEITDNNYPRRERGKIRQCSERETQRSGENEGEEEESNEGTRCRIKEQGTRVLVVIQVARDSKVRRGRRRGENLSGLARSGTDLQGCRCFTTPQSAALVLFVLSCLHLRVWTVDRQGQDTRTEGREWSRSEQRSNYRVPEQSANYEHRTKKCRVHS